MIKLIKRSDKNDWARIKVGDVFTFQNNRRITYLCVEGQQCLKCCFFSLQSDCDVKIQGGVCSSYQRLDEKGCHFLEYDSEKPENFVGYSEIDEQTYKAIEDVRSGCGKCALFDSTNQECKGSNPKCVPILRNDGKKVYFIDRDNETPIEGAIVLIDSEEYKLVRNTTTGEIYGGCTECAFKGSPCSRNIGCPHKLPYVVDCDVCDRFEQCDKQMCCFYDFHYEKL